LFSPWTSNPSRLGKEGTDRESPRDINVFNHRSTGIKPAGASVVFADSGAKPPLHRPKVGGGGFRKKVRCAPTCLEGFFWCCMAGRVVSRYHPAGLSRRGHRAGPSRRGHRAGAIAAGPSRRTVAAGPSRRGHRAGAIPAGPSRRGHRAGPSRRGHRAGAIAPGLSRRGHRGGAIAAVLSCPARRGRKTG